MLGIPEAKVAVVHGISCKFGAEDDPEMTAVLNSCAVVDFNSWRNLR